MDHLFFRLTFFSSSASYPIILLSALEGILGVFLPLLLGAGGLRFPCPIFRGAFYSHTLTSPRSWPTPSRAMGTALQEGPHLLRPVDY